MENKKKKKKEGKTRKTIYVLDSEKTMKTSFYYFQKNGFKNTENTKNKNTPFSLNKFFKFFVFNNRKQFLKTRTKHAHNFCCISFIIYKSS